MIASDVGQWALDVVSTTDGKARRCRGLQTAIDVFFRLLAADRQEKAIGIILSGTGSHGTLGLKEIKLVGGMMMVQDPQTADYDQMPRNAIGTRMVDYVLPPEQMPEALVRYVAQPFLKHAPQAPAAEGPSDQLNQILAVLRARTKYDFRHYRKKMLMRRVERRMGLCKFDELADYAERLRDCEDPVEIDIEFANAKIDD